MSVVYKYFSLTQKPQLATSCYFPVLQTRALRVKVRYLLVTQLENDRAVIYTQVAHSTVSPLQHGSIVLLRQFPDSFKDSKTNFTV